MFRLEIHHTTHIDKIPVDRLDAAVDEWRARPWWNRLIRRSPLVRAGSMITREPEELDGRYKTIEAAGDAAKQKAMSLDGVIRPDSTVMVVDDTGHVHGGWYPGDRGRA